MKIKKYLILLPVMILLFSCFTGVAFASGKISSAPTAKKDALNTKKGTVSSSVSAFGHSLSGMEYDEALSYFHKELNKFMKAELRAESADKDLNWSESFASLGITLNEQAAIDALGDSVLTGTLLNRYKKAKDNAKKPVSITENTRFNEEYILETVEEALQSWNCTPMEPSATFKSGELVVVPGRNGHTYEFSGGVREFANALKNGEIDGKGFDLEFDYTTEETTLSPDMIEDFTVIGSCTTYYAKPTTQILKNRQQNLLQSTKNMNGQVFAPGEIISALGLYGSVTAAGGYAEAGTYTTSGHSDEIGGGICQTTSTMYNAVLLAELEVIYRKNHSYLIDYLDPSMDAMVYAAGGSDFKFRNSSSDYLIIDAYVNTEDCSITVNLIGHEDHPASHSVRYESEIVSLGLPTLTPVPSDEFMVGHTSEKLRVSSDFSLHPACKSRLWKITTDNGVETRTAVGGIDTYKPMNDSIFVAPDITVDLAFASGKEMTIQAHFIDSNKTSVISDPASWTKERRAAFNAEMKELMAERGYVWPDEGDSYTRYLNGEWVVLIPNSMPDSAPTEDPSESDPTETETSNSSVGESEPSRD